MNIQKSARNPLGISYAYLTNDLRDLTAVFYPSEAHNMKLLLIIRLCCLAVFMALPVSAISCLWDRDTLADEAKGHGNIVEVMAGRFPRNPPLYYEMRLKRVTEEVKATPEKLDLYDDLGVACDRLGRGKEAIAWMEQKRTLLDREEESKTTTEHRYRYHANLGTFLAHEWIRSGADLNDMTLLQRGAEHIADAIEINPNAHFGREKYQLQFMEWVLSKPEPFIPGEYGDSLAYFIPVDSVASSDDLREASVGLQGLITLGNAWESVDVYYALYRIHASFQHGSICLFAKNRIVELLENGKKPILAREETTPTIRSAVRMSNGYLLAEPKTSIKYNELWENAEIWHANRTAFMLAKLEQGIHPDTNANFWDGYEEIPAVDLPKSTFTDVLLRKMAENPPSNNHVMLYLFICATGFVLICITGFLFVRKRHWLRKVLGFKGSAT